MLLRQLGIILRDFQGWKEVQGWREEQVEREWGWDTYLLFQLFLPLYICMCIQGGSPSWKMGPCLC